MFSSDAHSRVHHEQGCAQAMLSFKSKDETCGQHSPGSESLTIERNKVHEAM
jgi:hypothetical protein